MPVLPTLLTLGNAVCGLGSISYAASQPPAEGGEHYLLIAGLLIFGGMVFDMLDGSAARWTKQTSKFGGELDSLCDAITFGVAPAFLILKLGTVYPHRMLWAIAALYMACTVLRLARYNVETATDDMYGWFSGLPSPAAAATIASFAISLPAPVQAAAGTGGPIGLSDLAVLDVVRNLVPLIGLVVAGLMVSRIRYPHIAKQVLRGKRQLRQVAQIVFAIAAVVALGVLSAPLILCAFVVGAPISATWNKLGAHRARRKAAPQAPAESADGHNQPESTKIKAEKSGPRWWVVRNRPPRRRA